MPYKLRNNRRHKFTKTRYKINNWPKYNKALQERGSITLWLSDDIIKTWYAKKYNKAKQQGRQFKYSDLTIQAILIIKIVFHLTYRSLIGFLSSIVELMGINLDIPDYSRICRRAHQLKLPELSNISNKENINVIIDSTGLKILGQGQWSEEKHGLKKRKEWRKLHIIIDRDSQEIIAQNLTGNLISDESQLEPLIEDTSGQIDSISGDGGYDSCNVYKAIEKKSPKAIVAIPPHKRAVVSAEASALRKHNILFIDECGRQRWQDYSDYNYRALVETAMYRYKKIIGDTMFSRKFQMQKTESRIACNVLNKMAALGMPTSEKIKKAA